MTGQTLTARLKQHLQGAASWTRHNGPFQLIYQENYKDKTFAFKREKFLKSGRGREFLKRTLTSSVSLV